MPSYVMLSVIMRYYADAVMMSVIMLNVIMLSVIMLSGVASGETFHCLIFITTSCTLTPCPLIKP
jgi:hypothetical protein